MTVRVPQAVSAEELRPLSIVRHYSRHAEGSVLIEMGNTRVVHGQRRRGRAAVSQGQGAGLAHRRIRHAAARDQYADATRSGGGQAIGRTQEIQRLIGRSLRAVTDLAALGERTLQIDCDVLQADGGTRCASITGACVALPMPLPWCQAQGLPGHRRAAEGVRRRGVGRHRRGRAGARSRLRRGFGLRYRHERRDDGRRRLRRVAGHGGGRAVLARRNGSAGGAGRARDSRTGGGAKATNRLPARDERM